MAKSASTRLMQYPTVMAMLNEIERDSEGIYARGLNPSAKVSKAWAERFALVEKAVAPYRGKQLKEVVPKAQWKHFELIDDDTLDDVIGTLAAGEHGERERLLKLLKLPAAELEELMNEFFDGELSTLARKVRR